MFDAKFELQENLSLDQKLEILSDAAKYDVACTSSGVDRRGKQGTLATHALLVYATHLQPMEGVSRC